MRSTILALLGASLLLTACSSQSQNTIAAAPLPASVVGDLKNSNDFWDSRRPYIWSADSLNTSSSSVPHYSTGDWQPGGDRTWLERVGMRPDWGPTTHAYSPGWDQEDPTYITYGSIMEDTYDTTIGYRYGGGSATVEIDSKGNGVTTNASAQDLKDAEEREASGNGLRLSSGQTVGGSTSSSGKSGSASSTSGGGKTLRLPSGRVIDGETDQSAMTGSGRIVTLSTGGNYGTRGCPEPDPRDVTAGSGVALPVLIKGSCPVTTTILRYPEQGDSVFGSMDF